MKVYKWEALKRKACQALSDKFSLYRSAIYAQLLMIEQMNTDQPVKKWRENSEAMRAKAWEAIENWDIRCCVKLFEAFPSIIRKQDIGQTPTIEYDDDCNWIVMFA